MDVRLTTEQFDALHRYFEYSLIAVSDEEQSELVHMEKPLRDMLRDIRLDHREILGDAPDMTGLV